MLRLLVTAVVLASFVHAADIGDQVHKSIPVSSATRLALQADFGAIRVAAGGEQSAGIEVYFRGDPVSRSEFDRMLRDFKLDVRREGSDIRVTGRFQNGWRPQSVFWMLDSVAFGGAHPTCRNGECLEYSAWLREMEYRITVPRKFGVDLETSNGPISVTGIKGEVDARTSGGVLTFQNLDGPVNAHTSGGSITLGGGKGRAVAKTSGGSIRISDADGDVDASTSGGSIRIERTSGRVHARTSGGEIEIREAAGAVEASTSGGGVWASFVKQRREECRLTTSGGSIHVTLAQSIHMDLDAATLGGGVWSDFGIPNNGERHSREVRAPLNGGGPLLYLRTSGGSISVTRGD